MRGSAHGVVSSGRPRGPYCVVPPGSNDVGQVGAGVKEQVVSPFLKRNIQGMIFDIYPGEGKKGLIVYFFINLLAIACARDTAR